MISRKVRLHLSESLKSKRSNFHITARQRAESSSTAADLDFPEAMPRPVPKQTSRSQSKPTDDIIYNQLDSLLDSTFKTPNPAKRNPSQPADESSATMIETAFQNASRKRDPDKYYYNLSRKMQFPNQEMGVASRDAYQTLENTQKPAKRAARTVRSRPAVGRTIEVVPDRGVDFGRALRNLNISCAVNRVRQDLSRQQFHERPGMKRKRLKSERWRRMFKASFLATVRRVREMRRKGW